MAYFPKLCLRNVEAISPTRRLHRLHLFIGLLPDLLV